MNLDPDNPRAGFAFSQPEIIDAPWAPSVEVPVVPQRRIPRTPIVLFLVTCLTTYAAGGPIYCTALMFILACHEAGHWVQMRRYRVPASLPYFIPMPIGPLGTMGAVISMRGNMGDRKALFDIGISGPLAGLVPTIIFTIVGLSWSQPVSHIVNSGGLGFGESILFGFLAERLAPTSSGMDLVLHPFAHAGWVGMLLTAVNLFPIGQLDGGHILYAFAATWGALGGFDRVAAGDRRHVAHRAL